MTFVDYRFLFPDSSSETDPTQCLYEYVVGKTGIYIQAQKNYLSVVMRHGSYYPIPGLQKIKESFRLVQQVPLRLFYEIARTAYFYQIEERLYYLVFRANNWKLFHPPQFQTKISVRPIDPYDPIGASALVEVHSHGTMPAYFSDQDNKDETGFRIYTVIGNLDKHRPSISTRVGVYGNFWYIPSSWVYAGLPKTIEDRNLYALQE